MPFVREAKLFESFGRGWKIAREIAVPRFREIQMRIRRNPDENCKVALSWERAKWNGWVVCARYLRRNPDFLALCAAWFSPNTSVTDGFLPSPGALLGLHCTGGGNQVTKPLGTFSAQTLKQAVSHKSSHSKFQTRHKIQQNTHPVQIQRTFSEKIDQNTQIGQWARYR